MLNHCLSFFNITPGHKICSLNMFRVAGSLVSFRVNSINGLLQYLLTGLEIESTTTFCLETKFFNHIV